MNKSMVGSSAFFFIPVPQSYLQTQHRKIQMERNRQTSNAKINKMTQKSEQNAK